MPKRALMIAFHFPPIRISSGIQRTLKFATYLRKFGWEPLILSVSPRAYSFTCDDQLGEIPDDIRVTRAWGLDAKKHLSIGGRYLRFTALPDRYASWFLGAVWQGRKLIKRFSPQVIWSTYPIATAHKIGLYLHQWSGIPWVADFRDSMTEEGYPVDPVQRRQYLRIEAKTVRNSSRAVFTAPGAVEMYRNRYPDIPESRWVLIHNGYDEANFLAAEQHARQNPRRDKDKLLIVHAGVLYPQERDPRAFFQAIKSLKENRTISATNIEVRLRATAHDDLFYPMLSQAGITDIVKLANSLPYKGALAEMLQADGLLLFQSGGCNHQIPAKLYEYLRADRPILALTDPHGDTARTLAGMSKGITVPLDDAESIATGFERFVGRLRNQNPSDDHKTDAEKYSRENSSKQLAQLFDALIH